MSALFFPVHVYTEVAEEAPLILKWMTTVIAWHITGSHRALGGLCVRRGQAGRKPGLFLWLASECETPLLSGQRNLSLVDSVGNDTISILGTAASWLRSCGVTSNMYVLASSVRPRCRNAANTLQLSCMPRGDVVFFIFFLYQRCSFSCCFHIWVAFCYIKSEYFHLFHMNYHIGLNIRWSWL